MYVDFGIARGLVKFTWKELCLVASLACGIIYNIADTRIRLAACEKRIQAITVPVDMPGGNNGQATSGPPPERK